MNPFQPSENANAKQLKYGLVDGTVTHVSADATELPSYKPEHEKSSDTIQAPLSCKAMVTLNAQALEREGPRFQLAPGMQIAAEVKSRTKNHPRVPALSRAGRVS